MHIYISQRALEEGVNAIAVEMVPFSYMMLREGYDAESIIQFLESAEDEDFDFIYEQADSEMLSESVVDEMSDEEVLLYEEQIGLIINHFGLMEAAGAIRGAIGLAAKLKAMTPAALKQFVKNNTAARRLAERLGLLKKSPVPKTGTPKPTATPKTQGPKPKSSRTSQQQQQTASQTPKTQPTKSKTPPKTQPGGILKSPAARTTATLGGAALVGYGLNQAGLFPGANDPNIGNDGPGQSKNDTTTADNADNSTTTSQDSKKDDSTSTPRPPRKDPTTGTPWWIARNQSLIGKRTEFRSDVALKRFRNPSAKANFTNIRSHYEYLVDYLIAEGHAETVEEATYVMQQMGEEAAVEILSEVI